VVTRDADYLEKLSEYGFVEAMVVDDTIPAQLRHEGLYSMIVRTLVQTYGARPSFAPPYLPNGVTPPDWITAEGDPDPYIPEQTTGKAGGTANDTDKAADDKAGDDKASQ
jgi:hypothetical protein